MGVPKVFLSKESYDESRAMSLECCLAPRAVNPLVPFLEGLWVSGLGGRFQDLWKNWVLCGDVDRSVLVGNEGSKARQK